MRLRTDAYQLLLLIVLSLLLVVELLLLLISDAERLLKMSLDVLKKRLLQTVAGLSGVFFFSVAANAASVYNCSASGLRCVVKVEEGIIGDHIKVLNEKARVIANGRIIKRKGSYAVVAVKSTAQTIRKGYPVIVEVENRDSNLQWAASFSNKD